MTKKKQRKTAIIHLIGPKQAQFQAETDRKTRQRRGFYQYSSKANFVQSVSFFATVFWN